MQCRLKNIGFVLGRFPKLAGEKREINVGEKVMHVGKYICVRSTCLTPLRLDQR